MNHASEHNSEGCEVRRRAPACNDVLSDQRRIRPGSNSKHRGDSDKNQHLRIHRITNDTKKLGDRLRCPKPPISRIIHISSSARGQRCLSPSFFLATQHLTHVSTPASDPPASRVAPENNLQPAQQRTK